MKQNIEKFDPISNWGMEKREDFYEGIGEEYRNEMISRMHEKAKIENAKSLNELVNLPEFEYLKNDIQKALDIAIEAKKHGGVTVGVGGFVRDLILGIKPKDLDIEIYGIEQKLLEELLKKFGAIKVGAGFPVYKIGDLEISMPREDSKVGPKHTDFISRSNSTMLMSEAVKRRDITINALLLDIFTGQVIDKVGGVLDLKRGIIKATDPEKFIEDPLRVLRLAQFAGRFNFIIDPQTLQLAKKLCESGELKHIAPERFRQEWIKLFLKSPRPSVGLEAAKDLGIIKALYPEVDSLIGCPQEFEWHPEGDVWTHTKMVVDEAVNIVRREKLNNEQAEILAFSAFGHDFGKPITTELTEKKGKMRWTAHGHEEAGVEPVKKFLEKIFIPTENIEQILPLVREHLFPTKFSDNAYTDKAIGKLIKRLEPANIQMLVWLGEADAHGRGYWKDQPDAILEAKDWNNYPSGQALLERVKKIGLNESQSKVKAYIDGKKLVKMGLKIPGKYSYKFGIILDELLDAQLEKKITDSEDLRLANLVIFLTKAEFENKNITEELLNGERMKKLEMIEFIKDRFFKQGVHDMGTLTMTLLLMGKELPEPIAKNKQAILTAHKYGPVWFKHLSKDFYEGPWKSFYGKFEANKDTLEKMAKLDYLKQLDEGIKLIESPDQKLIAEYNKTFDIKPIQHSGKLAFYVTQDYPFEAGMMDGYGIMVQFNPLNKTLCVSVMNEDPEQVLLIDNKIRNLLPEFANAKKVGYLFAQNQEGEDGIYNEADGQLVYETLVKNV